MDNVIWLIDDDASVRESLVFLLSGMHWRVEPYESIAAFTAAHGDEKALTGCLLLDMRMPGKGGLAWLEEGAWSWPLLPVILIRPEVESGQLLPVLPDWEGPPTEIGAVYPSRRGLSPKVRVFRAANKTPWRCCVTLPYCLYCLRSHA